jgi:hypothetical protein
MSAVEHQGSGVASDAASSHAEKGQTSAQNPAWTFSREADELTIVRSADSQGCSLMVVLNDSPRTYTFRDERAMVRFQSDMETLLTHTGWLFVGFRPERRVRRDRRATPRINERRRWWTDSWLFNGK